MDKPRGRLGCALVLLLPLLWFLSVSALVFVFAGFFLLERYPSLRPAVQGIGSPYNLFAAQPPILGAATINLGSKEARPVILEQFFSKYRSPLTAYGGLMIAAADKYNIPWTLLPAIAGQESTFCRSGHYPENSYNCWGWGIHTRYTKKFRNFEQAVEGVAKGLGEYYRVLNIDRSWPIERQILTIKTLYNKTSRSWDKGVLYFIFELENFSSS